MGKFKKAVCKILNFAYSETREEYLHSKKGSLIRLSNTLSAYAYEIVSSDTPLRVIAQDGIFSDEFREFIGPKKYYEELFPWIEESI